MKTQHDFSTEEEAGFEIARIMQRRGAAFVVHALSLHADLVELVYDYQSEAHTDPRFSELRARAWKLLEKDEAGRRKTMGAAQDKLGREGK